MTSFIRGIFELLELHKLIAAGKGESPEAAVRRTKFDVCRELSSAVDQEILNSIAVHLQPISSSLRTPRPAAPPTIAESPIGWQRTNEYGQPSGFLSYTDGETRWPKSQTVPLYLRTPPKLTYNERDAVGYFGELEGCQYLDAANRHAATLRGLLDRLQ